MADRYHGAHARNEWAHRLEGLAFACLGDPPGKQVTRLRYLNELLTRAPEIALIDGLRPLPTATLEALITVGAIDSAVLAMIDSAAYMVSRGSHNECMATVLLPGETEDRTASGNTFALALIGAIAQALAETGCGAAEMMPVRFEPASARLH